MFREMRNKKREISLDEAKKILSENTYGILSTVNADNSYPYGFPISYSYVNEEIYLHTATEGLKIDSFLKNNKVCFTVVGKTEILPKLFTTNYESTIIYGEIFELNDEEKENALFELIKKYSQNFLEEGKNYIQRAKEKTRVWKIKINHISGKARK